MTGFDPVRVIEVLADHGVEFVIIGGFAAELHGAPIPATQDVDVTPSMSPENLARLSSALDDLGARIRANNEPEGFAFSHDAASLGRARVWNLTCPAGSFDVTFLPSGTTGYDDLVRSASVLQVHEHPVAVAALADIIRSKEAAGRPKDLATLPALTRWLRAVGGVEPAERTRTLADAFDRRRRRTVAVTTGADSPQRHPRGARAAVQPDVGPVEATAGAVADEDASRSVRSARTSRCAGCGKCLATIAVHTGDIPTGTLRKIERDLDPCLEKGWLRK